MTSAYTESQGTGHQAPVILAAKKQTITVDGCKVTINFNDRSNSNKTVIGEVKRLILDGLAKTS